MKTEGFFLKTQLYQKCLSFSFTVPGRGGELPVSWERQTIGKQRTCDIRAVSEADRVQTRFRPVPSHLIKLIVMESVSEDWDI